MPKGIEPWNKGLTKETDMRVRQQIENRAVSVTWRRNLSKSHLGKRAWNKGMTVSTDDRVLKYTTAKTGRPRPDMIGHKWCLGKKNWSKGLTAKDDIRILNRAKATLRAVCARPNKFEVRALAYLELMWPGKFSYCGDGSIMINGKSPDAIDVKTRTVALFNGVYWHLLKHKLQVTDSNKRLCESREAAAFIEMGYKVIFIWEDEI